MSCNNNILSINSSQGPQGPQGTTGPQGIQGLQGTAGTNGLPGDRYSTSSVTSLTIALGVQSLTVGIGLGYVPAQPIIISFNAVNYMTGTVTSYNILTGALVLNIATITGSGTYSSWTMSLSGIQGPPGIAGQIGLQGIQGQQGLQGQQGIQGFDGQTGPAGTSSYTYVAYADNVVSNVTTNFSYPNPLATTEWIAIIVSPTVITTPVAANFNNKWIKIKGNSGATAPGSVFTSGATNPVSPGTPGDVFFNTTTFDLLTYDGNSSAWIIVPFAYSISAWQTVSAASGYGTNVTFGFRQQGGNVIFKGYIFGFTNTLVTTDMLLFTLPVGYRPIQGKILPIIDYITGSLGIIRILTNGAVTLMGTITPIVDTQLWFDSVTFPLS